MGFKVTISVENETPDDSGRRYDKWDEIYSQEVDSLDVKSVVAVVNRMYGKKPTNPIHNEIFHDPASE